MSPAPFVTDPRPARPRRGWRRPVLWMSVALHAAILLALMITPWEKPPDSGLGSPSVSVILGPTTETPTSTTATPEAATGTPDAQTAQRTAPPDLTRGENTPDVTASSEPPQQAQPPAPPSAAQPVPPPPVAAFAPPTPAAAAPPPPASALTESDAALPVPPVPPAVAPPDYAPAAPSPTLTPQPPRTQEALLQPLLRPTPPSPPVRTTERPAVRPAPPRPPSPRPRGAPDGFPMPAFASLGGALSGSTRPSRTPSRESAGPVQVSSSNAFRPQFDISGDNLGPGWNRLIHDWIERHKYYPHEAAENGEEGVVAVSVTLGRDGHVRSVNLLQRSGSQWLDLALQALFRSQNLPPIPADFHEDQATINVQMHYILLR